MKKIIIILIIILVILVSALIYIYTRPEIEVEAELGEQDELYVNGLNNPGLVVDGITPTRVQIHNIFFTVEECVKTYIQNATTNNNQILYNLLDYRYISENNITIDNINQLFISNEENHLNKTREVYSVSRSELQYLLCKTSIWTK